MGKASNCDAGDAGEVGLIPGSGISPGGEKRQPTSSTLAWEIPWTEEPEVYGPSDHKEKDMTEVTEHAICMHALEI